MQKGRLSLLPNLLSAEEPGDVRWLPQCLQEVVPQLHGLIAESFSNGRRYLRYFLSRERAAALPLELLNEHSQPRDVQGLIEKIEDGTHWGLISDAGLPCIADPGAHLVMLARQRGLVVTTFPGPSSLMMALQLSGFSGQRFAFHGYLPRDVPARRAAIQELERRAACDHATQIWIEAPYRSKVMLEALCATLQDTTLLTVAVELTSSRERVVSQSIAMWRNLLFPLGKEAAVFLISVSK